jgi:hypothetical protein
MLTMKYPKMDTLFKRHGDDALPELRGKVLPWCYRTQELEVLGRTGYEWDLEEKVDGTNIRVGYISNHKATGQIVSTVRISGRTDKAQLPAELLSKLQAMFDISTFQNSFDHDVPGVMLFGEGYGQGIQKGGNYRRQGQCLVLFDVLVMGTSGPGTWLARDNVADIAHKFGVLHTPHLGVFTTKQAVDLVQSDLPSVLAARCALPSLAEGIVARSHPLMLDRRGRRIMFKLKARDFARKDQP